MGLLRDTYCMLLLEWNTNLVYFILIILMLVYFFFSSPGHRPCELLSWVSARRPFVSFSHLTLLLWNRWIDFNQTCHKCSLDGPLPITCSDWLKPWKSSCQKPPNQLNCDFAGMIIGWSCTKLVNRLLIGNSSIQYVSLSRPITCISNDISRDRDLLRTWKLLNQWLLMVQ
jgi:hypothetical protein